MAKDPMFMQTSLADQARDALREQILTGELPPGARIDLAELAAAWSISPTPLRDAVKALEVTGLVEIAPRRGVFVAELDRKGLRETFELRMAFEGMAARLASHRLPEGLASDAAARYRQAGTAGEAALAEVDSLVHDIVREHCGNERLKKLMESVKDLIVWSRRTIIRNLPEAYATTLPEHLAICDALAARDAEASEAAMRAHLTAALGRIETYLDAHSA
jgi:DNA-binding GntR family transcriptional regulator